MDHMEASYVFYVKINRFDQFEEGKINILTGISLGIDMLSVHLDWMVSVWFLWDPGDVFRRTSSDVLSIEECPFYIHQKCIITCHSSLCNADNKQTRSDRLSAHPGTVGIPSSYTQCSYTQPDSAWMEGAIWLSLIPFWLVANCIVFRTSHFFLWSSSAPFHNSRS